MSVGSFDYVGESRVFRIVDWRNRNYSLYVGTVDVGYLVSWNLYHVRTVYTNCFHPHLLPHFFSGLERGPLILLNPRSTVRLPDRPIYNCVYWCFSFTISLRRDSVMVGCRYREIKSYRL